MFSVRSLCAPSTPFSTSSSSFCCDRSKPGSFSSSRPVLAAASLSAATLRVDPSEPLKPVSEKVAYIPVEQEAVQPNKAFLAEPEPDKPRRREGAEEQRVPGIHVPRQKYIPVSKGELLDALLSTFRSEQEANEFGRFARCLDSVLHAEHKIMLEEMRSCYPHADSQESKYGRSSSSPRVNGRGLKEHGDKLDFRNIFLESLGTAAAVSEDLSRIAVATRFQNTFMKLLQQAQFEEISIQDLLLTRALNTDYLLTLPIYVDWKKALDSNAIIFRRGYTSEIQKGTLIVDKLDYLQSRFLQKIFSLLSEPLKKIGNKVNEALKNSTQRNEIQMWFERTKDQLMEQSLTQKILSYVENRYNDIAVDDEKQIDGLPIWIAAQRAVPRYEGFLSSVGPRGRLVRKLLTWMGLVQPLPDLSQEVGSMNNHSESYARSIFLSRITLSDIWKPASKESCGNNPWKIFRSGISVLFSKSILQEPAFQELILLYSGDATQTESKSNIEDLPLHLKIYERIPIPDLPVIFPYKKLSFRILDTIRLDIASIIGLLAFIVNYRFETITSSPSAFWLDIIATTALILFVSRVALGYKQTWDRYQLLVNRTLYEKTLASGFGSVHFLLDASEQQQYKEAVLAYALLLKSESSQIISVESTKDACENFISYKFGVKIEMPIDDAMQTLRRFGIMTQNFLQEDSRLRVLSCSEACEELQIRWNMLLG